MGPMANNPSLEPEEEAGGLSSRFLLDKIDQVRELGIDIPLPQVQSLYPRA